MPARFCGWFGDISLQEPSGTLDRVAGADPGDRAEPVSLRVPQDPRTVVPRELGIGKNLVYIFLSRRRKIYLHFPGWLTTKGGIFRNCSCGSACRVIRAMKIAPLK